MTRLAVKLIRADGKVMRGEVGLVDEDGVFVTLLGDFEACTRHFDFSSEADRIAYLSARAEDLETRIQDLQDDLILCKANHERAMARSTKKLEAARDAARDIVKLVKKADKSRANEILNSAGIPRARKEREER